MVSAAPVTPRSKVYIGSRILQLVLAIVCFGVTFSIKYYNFKWYNVCDSVSLKYCYSETPRWGRSGPAEIKALPGGGVEAYFHGREFYTGSDSERLQDAIQWFVMLAASGLVILTAVASLTTHLFSFPRLAKAMTFFMVWDALLSLLCLGASISIGVYLSKLGVWTYGSDTAHMYRTSFVTALLLSFFLAGTTVHAFFLRKNGGKQRQQDMLEKKLNSNSV